MTVISDRTQAPSGPGYAMATRRIISQVMAGLHRSTPLARLRGFFQTFTAKPLSDARSQTEVITCLSAVNALIVGLRKVTCPPSTSS